jgi:hypothetical protein
MSRTCLHMSSPAPKTKRDAPMAPDPSRLFLHEAHQCRSSYGCPAHLAQSTETLGPARGLSGMNTRDRRTSASPFWNGPKRTVPFEHPLNPRCHRGRCHQLHPQIQRMNVEIDSTVERYIFDPRVQLQAASQHPAASCRSVLQLHVMLRRIDKRQYVRFC